MEGEDPNDVTRWVVDELTYTEVSGGIDNAQVMWDDAGNKFRLKVGSANADLVVEKLYYKIYSLL